MFDRNEIINAYIFLRTHNSTIEDSVLDFIKDASLSAFDSLHSDLCAKCEHNGKQMIYPSNCTGCGSDGEGRNFALVITRKARQ